MASADDDVGAMGLIAIITERSSLVATRSLGGPYDLQEHVFADDETGREITLQSQACLVCGATGRVRLEDVTLDGVAHYKVHPGEGGPCELCGGTGRMPTKRTVRKGMLNAQQRAVQARQQTEIINAELHQLERGAPVMAWIVEGSVAVAHGAPPGQSLIALPHDQPAVQRAKALGGQQGWLYEEDYPVLIKALRKELAAEEEAWVEATETAEWFGDQLHVVTAAMSALDAQERRKAAAAAEAAAAAAVPPPKHDPAKVCNGYEEAKGKRKRCHRSPQEWDERGHGWCRRHARKRGLNVRQEGTGG